MSWESRMAAAAVVVAAIVMASAACGRPTAAIEGTVSYRGKPVPSGVVAVFAGEGRVVTGAIAAGRFAVAGLPLGEAVVTVQCDTPPDPSIKPPPGENIFPLDNPAMPKPAGPAVEIPARYADPETSPLRAALVAGPQNLGIVLLDE